MNAWRVGAVAAPLIVALAFACVADDPSRQVTSDGGLSDGASLDETGAGDGGSDGGGPTDGGSDAVVLTHCDDVDATFCEDFDKGPTVPGQVDIEGQFGSLTVEGLVFTSKSASLTSQFGPRDAGTSGFLAAYDMFVVPANGSRHVVAEFEWRYDLLGAADLGLVDLFILRADGTGGAGVHLQTDADAGATLSFGDGFAAFAKPPKSTWTHVRLEVTWPDGGGAAMATATVGSAPPVNASVSTPAPTSTFNLLIGGVRIGTAGAPLFVQHVDDVVIRRL